MTLPSAFINLHPIPELALLYISRIHLFQKPSIRSVPFPGILLFKRHHRMKYGILVPIVRQPFPLPLHPRIQLGAWIRRTHRDIGRVEMSFVDEFLQPFPSVRRFGASAHDKAAGNTDAVD